MIDTYKIKKINNEEVLFIYLDFNYEIGSFNLEKHQDSIKKIIQNFIKESKILFTGTIVTLFIGGVALGNIYLDKPVVDDINNEDIIIQEQLSIDEDKNNQEEIIISNEEIVEEKIESISNTSNKVDEEKNIVSLEEKQKNNNISNSVETIIENNNVIDDKEEITDNNVELSQEQVEEKNDIIGEVKDNSIYVKVKRNSGIIDIELEEYVIGVVAAEMPASFDIEALKAQAVIARTYALKANAKGQILTDNNSTQNYKDNYELQNMWGSSFNTYFNKIKNAVDNTKGIYLTYNGNFIEAVYHSTSNGQTENSVNVWGNSYPYLITVDSPYDSTNPSFYKEIEISYEKLSEILKQEITIDTSFNIVDYTQSNRVANIEVNGSIYSGPVFRNMLGLRSTSFEIEKKDTGILFKTKGYGHGVGMSQYGANGMAKDGYNYIQILQHYYPGTIIDSL